MIQGKIFCQGYDSILSRDGSDYCVFPGAMYGYFVRTYSGALCDVETDMLEQKSNNLIYLTENIKSLNNSIRLNYTVMEMCYKEEMDIYNLIEAQMQLDTIRVSSDLIHSIYLVNKKTKGNSRILRSY